MSFEYGLASALNAVGFMHTVSFAIRELDIGIPEWIFSWEINDILQINPMACLLILGLTFVMLKGIKESILLNNIFTVSILVFYMYCNVLSLAIHNVDYTKPFNVGGISGIMKGAALCFFGYTSFE